VPFSAAGAGFVPTSKCNTAGVGAAVVGNYMEFNHTKAKVTFKKKHNQRIC
jgi:hypothetical protein